MGMPGIVGLQTNMPRGWAELQLKHMIEALQHENFYISGTWIDESIGVYVGWVTRGTALLHEMPLINDRGNLALILSGEVFPNSWTKQHVKVSTHRYGSGMSAYLIQLAESEANFPAELNGRFHGVLADRARKAAILFNDRYAMHRIYYHQANDAFYFAAEAKAILAVCPELRDVNPRSLGEFVTCGCVLDNRTLFDGIHVLPGAARWVIRDGSVVQKEVYFKPRDWEGQDVLQPEKYYQELRDVFSQNLTRYFESKERIGLSLTGGLDTRIILAWLKSVPQSLTCYTFGGMYRDCRDVTVARKVAQSCGLAHEVIDVNEEFLSRFPYYAERTVYLTDGCADVRRASDLYLNKRVREIAPVRITGNYGSEVLRRARAFKPTSPVAGLFHDEIMSSIHQAGATYETLLDGHPLSFAVFKQAPWHHYGLLALEETQVSIRSPFLDNDLVRTVFRAPESAVINHDLCLRLINDGNPILRRIPTDRGVGGAGLRGIISQMTLEFLTKAEYAYDYGMPQWLAQTDSSLSRLSLERLFLGWQKFNHYRVWYRDALSDYVQDMLLDQRALSRPYIQRNKLMSIVQNHVNGHRNYTNEIHCVLTLEFLHRLFID